MRYLTPIILVLLLWSCSSSPPPSPTPPPPSQPPEMNIPEGRSGSSEEIRGSMPDWFTSLELSDEYYFGYGMAKKQNPTLSKKLATKRARDEVAEQVSAKIKTLVEDNMREIGVGESAQATEVAGVVSEQVASETLKGAVPDKQEMAKDGTWYVRVRYPKDNVKKAAVTALKSVVQNEEALYHEFQSKKAFERLEDAVSKLD